MIFDNDLKKRKEKTNENNNKQRNKHKTNNNKQTKNKQTDASKTVRYACVGFYWRYAISKLLSRRVNDI